MIVGTATLRIVLSSTMMNSALDRITKAIQRFGSGGPEAAPHPPVLVGEFIEPSYRRHSRDWLTDDAVITRLRYSCRLRTHVFGGLSWTASS